MKWFYLKCGSFFHKLCFFRKKFFKKESSMTLNYQKMIDRKNIKIWKSWKSTIKAVYFLLHCTYNVMNKFSNLYPSIQRTENKNYISSSGMLDVKRRILNVLWIKKLRFQKLHVFCYQNSSSSSSRPDVFCKKGALENFAKFTGKHLCQSLFFNKVATLLKRDSETGVFS